MSSRGGRFRLSAACVLVVAALVAGSIAPADAQIDVSGRWRVAIFDTTFGVMSERALTLQQSGSTLTVTAPSPYTGGTIDPVTGVLHLDGHGSCFNISTGQTIIIPWQIDAVAAADGSTFDGTAEESFQPTRACLTISGPAQGTRLPESCGNGVVDAGEVCDDGVDGSACCTPFCTGRTAGTFCAFDGGACTQLSACDGAGTCVQTPKPAGTVCRLASGPCDTAESCDGVSTACPPPFTPTEPDVDQDGVLDGCDDCVGQPLEAVRLRFGRFGMTSTRDFVSLRARVRLPAGATLPDPMMTWKLVELRDATNAPLLYAQVPGGAWDESLRQGWRHKGRYWTFQIDDPILGGVSRMRLTQHRDDPTTWDVRVTTPRAALLDPIPVAPLELKIIIDGLGPSTQCGQRRFVGPGAASPNCTAPNASGVITCR
jgi:hypothetical protein